MHHRTQVAEVVDCSRERGDLAGSRHVDANRVDLVPLPAERVGRLLELGFVRVREDDHASTPEPAGDRPAHAAGSGDHEHVWSGGVGHEPNDNVILNS